MDGVGVSIREGLQLGQGQAGPSLQWVVHPKTPLRHLISVGKCAWTLASCVPTDLCLPCLHPGVQSGTWAETTDAATQGN